MYICVVLINCIELVVCFFPSIAASEYTVNCVILSLEILECKVDTALSTACKFVNKAEDAVKLTLTEKVNKCSEDSGSKTALIFCVNKE